MRAWTPYFLRAEKRENKTARDSFDKAETC